jgi:hypothetical protein
MYPTTRLRAGIFLILLRSAALRKIPPVGVSRGDNTKYRKSM